MVHSSPMRYFLRLLIRYPLFIADCKSLMYYSANIYSQGDVELEAEREVKVKLGCGKWEVEVRSRSGRRKLNWK
jgi:hypothetical protein